MPKQQIPDPRKVPRYTFAEVARLVGVPPSTVRSWFSGMGKFKPILRHSQPRSRLLSFENLIEVHVVRAFNQAGVRTPKVRVAVDFLTSRYGKDHPLASWRFMTDGRDVYMNDLGKLINLSKQGQGVLGKMLDLYLKRIEHDAAGGAVRLFPMRRDEDIKPVVVDPCRSFGRPLLEGTRIPLDELLSRRRAGESIESIADDFDVPLGRVRQTVEWWSSGEKTAAA